MFFAQSDGCGVRTHPLRNGALSHRLRLLRQTVLINNGWAQACKAHHEASVRQRPEAVLAISGISGLVA